MPFSARPYILHEANLAQLRQLKPNVAVLPWGATEAHNFHLPYGTDVIEALAVSEESVRRANAQGARCLMLPCLPFGNDNLQLATIATITLRTSTQQLMLRDIAESLTRQGIDRLVIVSFHGGNDFRQIIRDLMMDLPIFIAQVNAWVISPEERATLDDPTGDHADEFETSLLLHLTPQLVAPLETADDGATTPYKLPAMKNRGVWAPRDWASLSKSSGAGNPKAATAEKGARLLEHIVENLVPVLVQLSQAQDGDFPYIVKNRNYGKPSPSSR